MIRRRRLLGAGALLLACLVAAGVLRWMAPDGSPARGVRLGVYMTHNNAGLDALTSDWPVQPNIASFYLPWNSDLPALLRTYAEEGRELQVELATQVDTGTWVRWADIAAGDDDAHIIGLIKVLDTLGVPVLLSLDNEPDAKATSGTGEVAPGQTAAEYVAAANHVADLIHANSTHVRAAVWLAGFQPPAVEASFLPALSKVDDVGWDPYKTGAHPVSQTPTDLFAVFIDTVLVPYGYEHVARHINETGVQVDTFTPQAQSDFWAGIPAAMSADDIASVVWFRDDSGRHPYVPTDPSPDQAFADMVADTLR